MNKKLTNFAFVGLLGLNLFRPVSAIDKDRNSTPTGEKKERIEARIEKFKDTRATLKNVKITAVLTASITVDNGGTSVVVNITDKTQLRRKFWGKSVISEFSVGDTVNIVGKWTDDTKTVVNAVTIRNESIQKRNGVFFGEVKSLSSGGFVMTTIHRVDETVTIGTAKITDRKGGTLTGSDIKVGDRVRVRGMWDSNAKTITEVKEVKDFSLPLKPSPTPVATP